jgi:hypothetical protein
METKRTKFKSIVFNLLLPVMLGLLFLSQKMLAQQTQETYYGGLYHSEIVSGATFEVSDTFPTGTLNISARGVVWFSIDEEYKLKDQVFTASVNADIQKYDQNNTLIGTDNITFTVNYNPSEGASYNQGYLYEFPGVYRIKVIVKNSGIGITPSIPSLTDAFRLEGKILVNRVYSFNCQNTPTIQKYALDDVKNVLVSGWSSQPGAQEYDLEWTFYDTLSVFRVDQGGAAQNFNALFLNNATRITTKQTTYPISLVYPAGRIYIRVRGVQYDVNGIRIQGLWDSEALSYSPTWSKDVYRVPDGRWHEKMLNWQMGVQYAEEGKRSQSIQYLDGLLRSRQHVAKSDGLQVVMASETLYDHQGRAAIQVMPTPVTLYNYGDNGLPAYPWLQRIQYNRGLSAAPGLNYYSADHFDGDNSSCSPVANPALAMDSTKSIASRYYSSSNPWRDRMIHNNIPGADGFPFAVMEYMADGTNRIRRQGNVGKDFQLGTAHEQKYYYGKPDQDELDRLFGVEAGYSSHYQKVMTMDPNGLNNNDVISPGTLPYTPGQMTVSYVDMHGRTVATALAGDPPANLTALPNMETASTVTKKLLYNVASDMAQISTYSLTVSSSGTPATFSYRAPSLRFDDVDCLQGTRCYSCLYDVEIKIVDECGNAYGGTPIVVHNYDFNNFDALYATNPGGFQNAYINCGTQPGILTNQIDIANLPLGQYQVTKTLRISNDVLNKYIDDYVKSLNCLPTQANLSNQYLGDTSCYATCADCKSRLGTFAQFKAHFFNGITNTPNTQELAAAQNAYNDALAQCNEICNEAAPTMCDNMYQAIITDMMPGGQYATFVTDMTGSDDDLYAATTTDPTSIYYLGTLKYQNPNLIYYDESGKLDTVFLSEEAGFKLPNALSVNEFIRYFKPSWAKTLIQLHPEYCQYQCCMQINDRKIDSLLDVVTSFPQAVTLGLWPLPTLMSNDPFFAGNGTLMSQVQHYFDEYTRTDTSSCGSAIPLIDILSSIVFCKGQFPPCTTGGCSSDSMLLWQLVVNQYLNYKNYLKSEKIRSGNCGISGSSFNPCPPMPYCFGQVFCNGVKPNPYQNKVSRVPTIPYVPQKQAEIQLQMMLDSVRNVMGHNCDSLCAGNADNWILQLQQTCPVIQNASPVDLDSLRSRLIKMCTAGCDVQHPFGSSAGVSNNHYHDIQSIIISVFPILNDSCTYAGCRGELIDYPGSYTVPQYLTPEVIRQSVTNGCDHCALYTARYNCWSLTKDPAIPATLANFTAYVNSLSNVTVTQDDISGLCTPAGCVNLPKTVTVHPLFECGSCKTYTEVNVAWGQAKLVCPNQTTTAWKNMVAARANLFLGLNRSYDEYDNFLTTYKMDAHPECRFLCPNARFAPVVSTDPACVSPDRLDAANLMADLTVSNMIDSLRRQFIDKYLKKCLGSDLLNSETFTYTGLQAEYQYTLYYYDQAGNLVKTIPPKGVHPITDPNILTQIKQHRITGPSSYVPSDFPAHAMETRYVYNSINKMVQEMMPDYTGNGTYEWHDKVGRTVLSQNAQQRLDNDYSYFIYDGLGRVVENGTVYPSSVPSFANDLTKIWNLTSNNEFTNWINGITDKREVTQTYFDNAITGFTAPCTQDNLRNRIASVTYSEVLDSDPLTFSSATHYSYDVDGYAKCLLQDIPELTAVNHRYTRVDYDYDLISGKVNYIYFQKNQIDQFIQHYKYDADNRLQMVETSRNGLLWTRDANYQYYLHGPLARMELGQLRVQGVDYAYTIRGWLKGVNASALALTSDGGTTADFLTRDMGRDGKSGNMGDWASNIWVARDVMGFTLGYYNNYNSRSGISQVDYRRIGKMPTDVQTDWV